MLLFRSADPSRTDTFNPPPYVEGGTVRPSLRPAGTARPDTFILPYAGSGAVPVPLWARCVLGNLSTCLVYGRPGPVVSVSGPFGGLVSIGVRASRIPGVSGASGSGRSGWAMSQQLRRLLHV